MGRLLHDVGAVSAKEVHKNQREAAQAGKVQRRSRGHGGGDSCGGLLSWFCKISLGLEILTHQFGSLPLSPFMSQPQVACPTPVQASFAWAWALDERPEERARGVTVDVAMQARACCVLWQTSLDRPLIQP